MTPTVDPHPPLHRVYGLPAWLVRAITIFPIPSALIITAMLAIPATHARGESVLAEDHMVENFTFIAYFIATGIATVWVMRLRRRPGTELQALGIAAIGAINFGLGMEEISWGQRVFHTHWPKLFGLENVQGESNLHNIGVLHDLSSWYPFVLGVIALVAIYAHTRRHGDRTGLPSLLLPYAWVVVAYSAYDNFTDWVPVNMSFDTLISTMDEHNEMLVSFMMALGLWLAMRRETRSLRER